MIDPSARIHATAETEPDVRIGAGTSVWHRTQIRTGATIGRDGTIGRDVFIDEGVQVGDRVKIQNGALLYHGVTLADGVFIGPGAILTNDRRPRAMNAAGRRARAEDWTVSPIRIGVGASIGAGAVVVAGCDIGPYAMVGAGSVVTHDVPAHALVVGNPARGIGWVCVCGEGLVDATGRRGLAERELPSPDLSDPDLSDPDLSCPVCGRQYDRRGDGATLHQRTGPADVTGVSA